MSARAATLGFGFSPEESEQHFLLWVPNGNRAEVTITEHLSWSGSVEDDQLTYAMSGDHIIRASLDRHRWDAIAEAVRQEFNARLRKVGGKAGQWKVGKVPLSRSFGKELVLLAWAIEDADPGRIPVAIQNWLGLAPEERWWLYTMTSAATGHAIQGRGRGWRVAVRYALTDNPVSDPSLLPQPRHLALFSEPNEAETPPATRPKRRAAT